MKIMDITDTITLPGAIARYLEAANHFDAAAAAACFTPDATVRDEAHSYVGTEAIKTWVSNTSEKYRPQTTALDVRETGPVVAVKVRVEGQFPGSPVELDFEFSLRNDAIAELTIK
jgi:ketosteroid isomerase-like protein